MQLILVISPDPQSIEKIEYYLTGKRLRIVSTTQPSKGLVYAKSSIPDLVILGLESGNKEVREALAILKKDPITQNSAFLGIYKKKDDSFENQMKWDGVDDYIIEPFQKADFLFKIQTVLDQANSNKTKSIAQRKNHISTDYPIPGMTRITFHSGLKKYVAPELKNTLTKEFFLANLNSSICIDIRDIPEITSEEIEILVTVVKLFGKKRINIVAGKNLGILLTETELADTSNLFMSPEEYEELFNKKILEN
ncbi:MAG: hypothetical protein SFU98_18280 [Leptospiraceae bacterium]|nr:hypothetical protein [Leptospiraceae bacterium]